MPCDCGHPRKPDHYQNGGIIRCHCGCEYGHGTTSRQLNIPHPPPQCTWIRPEDQARCTLGGYWHPRHVFPEVTV
jgi:hypothetical protein